MSVLHWAQGGGRNEAPRSGHTQRVAPRPTATMLEVDGGGLTSLGMGRSSASVWPSSSSSGGSGLVGGGCCHTMASWACSLRYRLVRWVRLTLLTTFLQEGTVRVGGGCHSPCGLCSHISRGQGWAESGEVGVWAGCLLAGAGR